MNPLTAWRSASSTGFGHRPELTDTLRAVVRPAVHALTAGLGGAAFALIVLQIDQATQLHLPVAATNAHAVVAGLVATLVTIAAPVLACQAGARGDPQRPGSRRQLTGRPPAR